MQTAPEKSDIVLIYPMKPGHLSLRRYPLFNSCPIITSTGLNNIKRLRTGRPDQHLRYHRLQYRCLRRSHHLRPAG
ncbi:hypothetical protein E1890_24420 [Salmonella enterica subsp. enterica serovar Mountpleasant]|nr:hypothetical protein [Salmonella enterica subsp. enterica serovar Mountpleasant]